MKALTITRSFVPDPVFGCGVHCRTQISELCVQSLRCEALGSVLRRSRFVGTPSLCVDLLTSQEILKRVPGIIAGSRHHTLSWIPDGPVEIPSDRLIPPQVFPLIEVETPLRSCRRFKSLHQQDRS